MDTMAPPDEWTIVYRNRRAVDPALWYRAIGVNLDTRRSAEKVISVLRAEAPWNVYKAERI